MKKSHPPGRAPKHAGKSFRQKKHKKASAQGISGIANGWLYGHHAVKSALKARRRILHEVWLKQELLEHYAPLILEGVHIAEASSGQLDNKFPGKVHQGVALKCGPLPDVTLEEVIKSADLLLMLDQVTDPHNLGAILRTADGFGCQGVLLPRHNTALLTDVAAKAASGAAESVPVIEVGNLNAALEKLKQADFWSIGLDGDTEETLSEAIQKIGGSKTVFVMGSEGDGLRPLVAKNCDYLARIPMYGTVESLNVSVATGIALYESLRAKGR